MNEIKVDSHQRDFLMMKLNSDMSPAASDKFVPLLIKELGELKEMEAHTA
jgi:hypothetical protein